MEYKDIDEKDNASLMTWVKDTREVISGGFKDKVNIEALWYLIHKLRYAESAMKFRNLPLDHEKLGPKITLTEIRTNFLVPTEN